MTREDALARVLKADLSSHGNGCVCCKAEVQGETPPADDAFIQAETALAALLLLWWTDIVATMNVVERLTKAAESRQPGDIDAAAALIGDQLSTIYEVQNMAPDVEKELRGTFDKGMEVAGAALVAYLFATRKRVVTDYAGIVRYYVNNYFRRIVHGAIMTAVNAHVTSLSGSNDLPAVVSAVAQQHVFDTEAYWRIVSNQNVSRVHHYGMLRGFEERGYRGYVFVAVIDARTTSICRAMDGREFWIADGLNLLDTIAGLANPEDVQHVAPWSSAEDVAGLSSYQLVRMGLLVPPLHAYCRSTIHAIPN